MSATRKKNGQFRKGASTSGAKKSRKKKGGASKAKGSIAARVTKLEKNMKTVVAVLHTHEKALQVGGLLTARGARAKALPGGR